MLINLGLVALFVALVGCLLVLLARHRPAFYVPIERRSQQVLADNANAFSEKAQRFISAVWSEQDFRLEVTDDEVNGYLAAANDENLWQQLKLRFTRWRQIFRGRYLHDVQVDFTPDRVTAGGRIRRFGMTFVITLSGRPSIDEEGRVRLAVTDVSAGALPIPRFVVGELLAEVDNKPVPAHSDDGHVTAVEVLDGKVILHGKNVREETTR